MEDECNNLKNTFMEIVEQRNEVILLLDNLKTKIVKMQEIYFDFIKTNHSNMFVFGLDALRFQGKLFDIEYDDMIRMLYAINNRMYCEYYKMYKIINDYMIDNIKNDKTIDAINFTCNFPIYKDLEPYKQYDFEVLKQIHEKIIVLISTLNIYILNKERELKIHRSKNSTGLNIDNFVCAFNYEIVMLREKESMFVSYMKYFHKLHTKYIKRFYTKVQLMYSQLNNDIKLDTTAELNNTAQKKELIQTLNTENGGLNRKLIAELKRSIHDKSMHIDTIDSFDNLLPKTPFVSPSESFSDEHELYHVYDSDDTIVNTPVSKNALNKTITFADDVLNTI